MTRKGVEASGVSFLVMSGDTLLVSDCHFRTAQVCCTVYEASHKDEKISGGPSQTVERILTIV